MAGDGIDWECTTDDGRLTIAGVLMHRPAFAVLDVAKLWEPPSDERGDDTMIPGRDGELPNPRRSGPHKVSLRLLIDGRWSPAGADQGGDPDGLLTNVRYLRANVSDPVSTGDGTRTVTLTTPGGDPLVNAPAHVSAVPGARVGPMVRWALLLSFPDGPPVT